MRWLWSRRSAVSDSQREVRQSGGDFSDAVVRLIEAQAAGQAADASTTAAVEAAAGLLSRAFMGAEVDAPAWVQDVVSPSVLGQIGRDLVRRGDSLHVIRTARGGMPILIPCSSWHWEGSHDPATWMVRATAYGPSTSTTWRLPADAVVFVKWGSNPGQPYIGTAPIDWASTTARLHAASEKSLADEAGGPVAQILPMPMGPEGEGGDEGDPENDPMALLRQDIAAAKGKAILVETTAGGHGEGRVAAPQKDWVANRLGPAPPDGLIDLADKAFSRVLAATGTPPSLFNDADGTSQREAIRRWHLGTVLPLARLLQDELARKLAGPVRLVFDGYPKDMVSRAQVFARLIAAEGVTVETALAISGLIEDGRQN